jgi:hypothetical protein
MKNNNTENNIMNYKDALEAADERAELGKKHITDIAMTCSNDYTVLDSLMCILELFTVKDVDSSVCDLANGLQDYLFRWTKEYGNSVDAWKDSVLYGTKYKDAPGDENLGQKIAQGSEDGDLRSLASQISSMMRNDAMPTQLFNVMADEFSHTPRDWRTPENILGNLKEMKKAEVKND